MNKTNYDAGEKKSLKTTVFIYTHVVNFKNFILFFFYRSQDTDFLILQKIRIQIRLPICS